MEIKMELFVETKIEDYRLKHATIEDVTSILALIHALAEYENLMPLVQTTEEDLRKYLFEQKMAEVVIGVYHDEPVGYILFFHNYSTFTGKPGIYLEDLFVKPEYRKMGFGKIFFEYLGSLAKKRNCRRLEWTCLDWNEPSIRFYESRGGKRRKEWNLFRLDGKELEALSDS